jgi:crotonobetainyl-CoA:carnitine CoA-transferase CaiB-like acyl-CoA transferase
LPGPLAGIRIIDVSAVVSGPLAVMLLADQGADVIKVEPPGYGDVMRTGPWRRGGQPSFYLNCNRSKRGIVLDLQQEAGKEVLRELVKDADVFVQNWRPGAAERLGFGWDDLSTLNPNLIHCSVSGYGPDGPYAQRRVYDPIIQGMTGHVAVQENPDVPIPDLVRNIVSDKSSAYTAAQAITAALFARERGAGGQKIEVPMVDASLAFFWPDGMMKHTHIGEQDVQGGSALYDVYRLWDTADGRIIWFAASESEYFGLFRALGKPGWCEDPRFSTMKARVENEAELGAEILKLLASFPTAEIYARMVEEDVPAGRVLSIDEMLEDEQLRHNEAIIEMDHPTAGKIRMARPAARFHGTPQQISRPAPTLGEHTDEVLTELGYAADRIAALRKEEVIP